MSTEDLSQTETRATKQLFTVWFILTDVEKLAQNLRYK